MEELRIEKFVAGGFGLARTSRGVALIRGALPGELVRAELRERKGYLEGEAAEVLEAHPGRYQNPLPPTADLPLEYPYQLAIKQGLVAEALERVGKISFALSPIEPSPDPLGYRTAAQYAIRPDGGLAYRQPGSHQLERIDEDPLLAAPLQKAFEIVKGSGLEALEVTFRGSLLENRTLLGIIGGKPSRLKEKAFSLVEQGIAGVSWATPSEKGRFRAQTKHLAGAKELLEDFGGVSGSISLASFSQVNPKAAGKLYLEAAKLAGGGSRALELYAGSGLLSLQLADQFEQVIALDISRDAVLRGQKDAKRLKKDMVSFHRGDAKQLSNFMPASLVAVDPPRAGLAAEVIEALSEARPRRILYIACEPASWARDVKKLTDAGYGLEAARPYDFYPFTHHTEVLSLLVLR